MIDEARTGIRYQRHYSADDEHRRFTTLSFGPSLSTDQTCNHNKIIPKYEYILIAFLWLIKMRLWKNL